MAPTEELGAGQEEVVALAAGEDAEAEEAALDEVRWEDIHTCLRPDGPRMTRMLELFEQRYNIASPSEAFIKIRPFLGEYLVREFDHDRFCQDLASPEAEPAHTLLGDLGLACSLMLRVAVAVAKAYHLEMSDWTDINRACSDALRMVPACYVLQRSLPGALNVARNLRFAATPNEDNETNPWTSHEGRQLFEKSHGMRWDQVEVFTSQDREVRGCFAGAFRVSRVTPVQELAIVALDALHVDEAPAGFPAKSLREEDTILWEVENTLGNLLEPGVVINADWCEMQNDVCFISFLRSVAPEWADCEGGVQPEAAEEEPAAAG